MDVAVVGPINSRFRAPCLSLLPKDRYNVDIVRFAAQGGQGSAEEEEEEEEEK